MDGFEVISTYTDAQACEDGTLVALNPRDRVTRTVWEFLVAKAPKDSQPPNRWPVDMMGWFRASKIDKKEAQSLILKHGVKAQEEFDQIISSRKALALSRGIISTHGSAARRVYEENTDGGIYKLFPLVGENDVLECLETHALCTPFWLLPNENGGITLMFPDDY